MHCDGGSPRPMRAMNLANKLKLRGHEVFIWSSAFNHQSKTHRSKNFVSIEIAHDFHINLLPSIGYKKHIGFARLLDHAQLGFSLSRKLSHSVDQKPDIAFVGFPPIETAAVFVSWLKKNRVPVILDVKDLWPWIFIDALPPYLKFMAPVLLYPYIFLAKRAIGMATAISSITSEFLIKVQKLGRRNNLKWDMVVPLTSAPQEQLSGEIKSISKWWEDKGVDLAQKNILCFVGAVSRAYDFRVVVEMMRRLHSNNINCQLVICGGGEDLNLVKSLFSGFENVVFSGWVGNPKIQTLISASIATIAPYKSTNDFMLSIPNKIIDSLRYGLPIITSLDGVTRKTIESYNVGYYCGNDPDRWYDASIKLLFNRCFQEEISINAKNLYDEQFAFDIVYDALIDQMELMVAANKPLLRES